MNVTNTTNLHVGEIGRPIGFDPNGSNPPTPPVTLPGTSQVNLIIESPYVAPAGRSRSVLSCTINVGLNTATYVTLGTEFTAFGYYTFWFQIIDTTRQLNWQSDPIPVWIGPAA